MKLPVILLLAFILRLLLAFSQPTSLDLEAYGIVAGITARGGNVYAETTRYNYTPVWSHVIHTVDKVSRAVQLPFHAVVRAFLSLIDLANALLIGAVVQRQWGRGRTAAALYFCNPGVMLITGGHAQFESLAILPLLCAVYLVTRHTGALGQA